jgi:Fe2+ transport system protein FeoA
MRISDLEKGDRAIIKRINADESLKQRLASFGMGRGVEIEVETYSIKRKTYEINVDNTMVALRDEEADKIEVEKV